MKTVSFVVQSLENLDLALDRIQTDQFQPTVAIGFSSPDFPFSESISIFKRHNIELVGCTTSGEVCNDQITHSSFSVLLMGIHPQYFRTIQFEHKNPDAYSSGIELYNFAQASFSEPGIILFVSGVGVVGDGPVDGLRDQAHHAIPIYGGLAGDNLQHKATHVFTNEGASDFGVSALILDTKKIHMQGLAVSGWQPLGKVHTVTRAERNILYEIDGKPALDLFLNYFGNIKFSYSDKGNLYSIAGQYPIRLQKEGGGSALRSLLTYDTKNRTLIAAGKVSDNEQFRFCPPPNFSVIEETIQEFQSFGKSVPRSEAVVMISCKGRHTSFGPLLIDEIRAIYEIWRTPMVGFLSNGEIGKTHVNGSCEFHNVSCSLVTLTEV